MVELDVKKIREDFPIFENDEGLVYLDSAATSQRPKVVIDAVSDFLRNENSNVSRGLYGLAESANERFENSRRVVGDFIGAKSSEIVFTRGATDSLNILARVLDQLVGKGRDEILLSEMEHHSNLVPWQELAKRKNMKLKFVKVRDDFTLDMNDLKSKITKNVAVVSIAHVSNVLGVVNPVREISEVVRSNGSVFVVDAAQSVPHLKVDVRDLGCDFLVFSSHKMLGPFGVGVLFGREELLEKLSPDSFGGGIVENVDFEDSSFKVSPFRFEAGTQNISGVIGLGAAVSYLCDLGMEKIEAREKGLFDYAFGRLKEIPGVEIYSLGGMNNSGILSFNIDGVHSHDVACLLDEDGVAIRAGNCCAQPLMRSLGLGSGVCRVSFYFYNSFEDVDRLVEGLKKIKLRFGV